MERIWYTERYIHTQLHGEPVWRTRIRERAEDMPNSTSDRVVATNLVLHDAERICAAVNPITINV